MKFKFILIYITFLFFIVLPFSIYIGLLSINEYLKLENTINSMKQSEIYYSCLEKTKETGYSSNSECHKIFQNNSNRKEFPFI
jgi:hypothetical protein